jgi:hypothetical protein
MLEQNDKVLVFFGGDLNLRDTEVRWIVEEIKWNY